MRYDHNELLVEGSGISQEVIDGRGYRSIEWDSKTDEDYKELVAAKIPPNMRGSSGILIPMYGPSGKLVAAQYRVDEPIELIDARGKKEVRRYASPKGRGNRLDVHPSNKERIHDVSVPLVITEGVKKADSLASRGQCVVAMAGVYAFRNKMGTLGDWEEIPLKDRHVILCYDADAYSNPMVAKSMARLGNWLRSRQVSKVTYLVVPGQYEGQSVKGADDFFVAGGTWEELYSHGTTKAPSVVNDDVAFSDVRLAELVAEEIFEGKFCFIGGERRGYWYKFDGKVWREVEEKAAKAALMQYAGDRHVQAAKDLQSGNGSRDEVDGWRTMLSARKLNAVLSLASCVDGVYMEIADFNADRDLLNVQNGVVDLTTGELLPHDPNYMMTRITAVDFIPGAKNKDWDMALEAIPEETRPWSQIRFGQAITGHLPDDDVAIIMRGGGRNGKSTIWDGVEATLGGPKTGYAKLISPKIIMALGSDSCPPEAIDLLGLRWAQLEETAENGRLDVTKLKQAVGTSQMTVAAKFKNAITFDTTHTLFISTNNDPIVTETDEGSWRRLLKMDFPYTYLKSFEKISTPNQRMGDATLKPRVRVEKDIQVAILAWLVEGAQMWYDKERIMPEPPARVRQDTDEWRMDSDQVLRFIRERLVFAPDYIVATSDLHADMNEWLETQSSSHWGVKTFVQRFQGHSEIAKHGVIRGRYRKQGATFSHSDRVITETSDQFAGFSGLRFKTKVELRAG